MEETKNLADLSKSISGNMLDSLAILDTLKELVDGDYKEDTLISIIRKNLKSALEEIEQCRKLINGLD